MDAKGSPRLGLGLPNAIFARYNTRLLLERDGLLSLGLQPEVVFWGANFFEFSAEIFEQLTSSWDRSVGRSVGRSLGPSVHRPFLSTTVPSFVRSGVRSVSAVENAREEEEEEEEEGRMDGWMCE